MIDVLMPELYWNWNMVDKVEFGRVFLFSSETNAYWTLCNQLGFHQFSLNKMKWSSWPQDPQCYNYKRWERTRPIIVLPISCPATLPQLICPLRFIRCFKQMVLTRSQKNKTPNSSFPRGQLRTKATQITTKEKIIQSHVWRYSRILK